MFDGIVVALVFYGCEPWALNKKEQMSKDNI